MSTGCKTSKGAVGLDPDDSPLKHIIEFAEQEAKSTGVVTTVQISHATPASFVAHNESRSNYKEIALEMIRQSALEVIMGCGNPDYDNDGKRVKILREYKYVGGKATWADLKDGLADGADADADGKCDEWTVIQSADDFRSLADGPTPKRVIGICKKYKTLQEMRGGDKKAAPYAVAFNCDVPTLSDMTAAAINVLDNNPNGFLIMIEGGAIDWAGHRNQSGRVIEGQIEFNRAVKYLTEWIEENSSWSETLLIVIKKGQARMEPPRHKG